MQLVSHLEGVVSHRRERRWMVSAWESVGRAPPIGPGRAWGHLSAARVLRESLCRPVTCTSVCLYGIRLQPRPLDSRACAAYNLLLTSRRLQWWIIAMLTLFNLFTIGAVSSNPTAHASPMPPIAPIPRHPTHTSAIYGYAPILLRRFATLRPWGSPSSREHCKPVPQRPLPRPFPPPSPPMMGLTRSSIKPPYTRTQVVGLTYATMYSLKDSEVRVCCRVRPLSMWCAPATATAPRLAGPLWTGLPRSLRVVRVYHYCLLWAPNNTPTVRDFSSPRTITHPQVSGSTMYAKGTTEVRGPNRHAWTSPQSMHPFPRFTRPAFWHMTRIFAQLTLLAVVRPLQTQSNTSHACLIHP